MAVCCFFFSAKVTDLFKKKKINGRRRDILVLTESFTWKPKDKKKTTEWFSSLESLRFVSRATFQPPVFCLFISFYFFQVRPSSNYVGPPCVDVLFFFSIRLITDRFGSGDRSGGSGRFFLFVPFFHPAGDCPANEQWRYCACSLKRRGRTHTHTHTKKRVFRIWSDQCGKKCCA